MRSAAARPTGDETRADVQCAEPLGERRVAAGRGPDAEAVLVGVVLHDRAAVRTGEPYGAADDAAQHLVEVQRGADRVADLPQHLELVHLGRQLLAPGAEGRDELDLPYDDGRLRSEGAQHVDLPRVEGVGLGAPHRQHADDVPVEQHRRGHQGAEAAEVLQVVPAVARVRQHVLDLLRPTVLGHPAEQAVAAAAHGVVLDVAAELLGHVTSDAGEPERVTVEEVELGHLRTAQPAGAVDDGVEDLARVGPRTAERLEDLARRLRLLLDVELPAVWTQTAVGFLPRAFVHRTVPWPRLRRSSVRGCQRACKTDSGDIGGATPGRQSQPVTRGTPSTQPSVAAYIARRPRARGFWSHLPDPAHGRAVPRQVQPWRKTSVRPPRPSTRSAPPGPHRPVVAGVEQHPGLRRRPVEQARRAQPPGAVAAPGPVTFRRQQHVALRPPGQDRVLQHTRRPQQLEAGRPAAHGLPVPGQRHDPDGGGDAVGLVEQVRRPVGVAEPGRVDHPGARQRGVARQQRVRRLRRPGVRRADERGTAHGPERAGGPTSDRATPMHRPCSPMPRTGVA